MHSTNIRKTHSRRPHILNCFISHPCTKHIHFHKQDTFYLISKTLYTLIRNVWGRCDSMVSSTKTDKGYIVLLLLSSSRSFFPQQSSRGVWMIGVYSESGSNDLGTETRRLTAFCSHLNQRQREREKERGKTRVSEWVSERLEWFCPPPPPLPPSTDPTHPVSQPASLPVPSSHQARHPLTTEVMKTRVLRPLTHFFLPA